MKLLAAQFDIDEAVLTAFPSGITVGIRINKCSEVRSACLNDSQIHLSFYVIRRPVGLPPAASKRRYATCIPTSLKWGTGSD